MAKKTPKTIRGQFQAVLGPAGGRCDVVYNPHSLWPRNHPRIILLLIDVPGLKAKALVDKLNAVLEIEKKISYDGGSKEMASYAASQQGNWIKKPKGTGIPALDSKLEKADLPQ